MLACYHQFHMGITVFHAYSSLESWLYQMSFFCRHFTQFKNFIVTLLQCHIHIKYHGTPELGYDYIWTESQVDKDIKTCLHMHPSPLCLEELKVCICCGCCLAGPVLLLSESPHIVFILW